jgi:prevent-host-death family protein
MERVISATEARIHFGEVMRQVTTDGETLIVERAGKPQVVVLSLAEYKRLKARRPDTVDWWERVLRVREQIREELGGRPLPPVEDIIQEMREERDEQILGDLYRR